MYVSKGVYYNHYAHCAKPGSSVHFQWLVLDTVPSPPHPARPHLDIPLAVLQLTC